MRPFDRAALLVMALLAGASSIASAAGDDNPAATSGAQEAKSVTAVARPWLTDLAAARAQAHAQQRPILVRLGAEWCPWCRKLEAELAKQESQKALEGWTLVSLDVDKSPHDAQSLGVGSIPALRLMTPGGKVVASRDGFIPSQELIAWIEENRPKAGESPPAELTESGVPGAVAVVRLARQLDQSDALVREVAINRLSAYPDEAAATVVEAFASGSLQGRLAALELLSVWKAPTVGLDPWRPATVTEARLKVLREWAAKPIATAAAAGGAPSSPIHSPTPEQLAEAGREIDRLIAAEPSDAAPCRERLARLGRALLPVVRARLNLVETDSARERLTALRYRLAASGALVLRWPGGLERLAATDVATRHRAALELLAQAASGDEGLFLELFNDSDPLVRELALKGLDTIGESGDSKPLLALLADPEPNVRAAVLKQFAEHPSPGLTAELSTYVARETDPDLVVHAVRVLREQNSARSTKVLVGLLEHENWAVRAEAVEAIGKKLSDSTMNANVGIEAKADAYAALTERLDDADGFVVGRALTALKEGNLLLALEPLLRVADKHPELAAKVIETLSSGPSERPAVMAKALPRLRKFAAHPRVDVRAAVVNALADPAEKAIEPEVQAALADSESEVRVAAANMLMAKLHARRPQGSDDPDDIEEMAFMFIDGIDPEDEQDAAAKKDGEAKGMSIESWLTRFQEGKGRPAWMEPAIAPLAKMLKSASVEEQLAAALPLVALGRRSEAMPTLIAAARQRPNFIGEASHALPWLHLRERLELFETLLAANPATDQFRQLASQLSAVRDTRIATPLWKLTTRDELDAQAIQSIDQALRRAYLGSRAAFLEPHDMNGMAPLPKAERERLVTGVRPRAETGPQWQRLIALGLLLSADPEVARAAAGAIVKDAKAARALRADAFQVLLLSGDAAQASKEAFDAFRGHDPDFQKIGLRFILADSAALRTLRDSLHLKMNTPAFAKLTAPHIRSADALSEPPPALPKEIDPLVLKPLVKSPDEEVAALAGFALTLLGDPEGLEPLLRHWRKLEAKNHSWDKRVYQGIAELDDDAQVGVLERIYSRARAAGPASYTEAATVKDLYWSIRGMDGPNARRLRQRIRTEVGMPALRGEESNSTPF
jgi:HEAT repeat protein/thiol-disulfide isomerase/thioredoxin